MQTALNKFAFIMGLLIMTGFVSAQELLPGEKTLHVNPIPGPGVERVGSSGLPVPKIGNARAFRNNKFNRGDIPMAYTKGSYDTTAFASRLVYLNGVNITQIKNQELTRVNIRIDGNGNVYIDAPQYEVVKKQNYHPLLPNEIPKISKESLLETRTQRVYSKQNGLPRQAGEAPKQQTVETALPRTPEEAMQANSPEAQKEDKESKTPKPNENAPIPTEMAPETAS